MDTVVVTGAGGFLGRYLCPLLASEYDVVGAVLSNVQPVPGVEWTTVERGDGLASLVREIRPDVVIHAAFINRRPPHWTDREYLDKMFNVNLPLFKALAELNGKLLLISSSAVYGKAEGEALIDEAASLQPMSIYGLGKLFQEALANYYSSLGLRVSTARLFNLCGPGQKLGMVFPDWTTQARAIAEGKTPEMHVRHMKGSRDFVDVRDAARAITLMAREFKSGEVFNVASGEVVSLVEISEELKRLCPLPLNIVETEPNPSDRDVFAQRGSFHKIQTTYSWHPEIDWRQSLKDLWDWYGRQI
jgi:GDP-4-dehydro-6-deoxy-D-mannose reductase